MLVSRVSLHSILYMFPFSVCVFHFFFSLCLFIHSRFTMYLSGTERTEWKTKERWKKNNNKHTHYTHIHIVTQKYRTIHTVGRSVVCAVLCVLLHTESSNPKWGPWNIVREEKRFRMRRRRGRKLLKQTNMTAIHCSCQIRLHSVWVEPSTKQDVQAYFLCLATKYTKL